MTITEADNDHAARLRELLDGHDRARSECEGARARLDAAKDAYTLAREAHEEALSRYDQARAAIDALFGPSGQKNGEAPAAAAAAAAAALEEPHGKPPSPRRQRKPSAQKKPQPEPLPPEPDAALVMGATTCIRIECNADGWCTVSDKSHVAAYAEALGHDPAIYPHGVSFPSAGLEERLRLLEEAGGGLAVDLLPVGRPGGGAAGEDACAAAVERSGVKNVVVLPPPAPAPAPASPTLFGEDANRRHGEEAKPS